MTDINSDLILQDTFKNRNTAISTHLSKINGEINNLEKSLKKLCIPNDVVYELEMTVHNGEAQDGDKIYWVEKEGLMWESTLKRILFLKSHVVLGPEREFSYSFIDRQIETGIFHDWKKDSSNEVPLLEASVKIRLKMHPFLNDFMNKITEDTEKFATEHNLK